MSYKLIDKKIIVYAAGATSTILRSLFQNNDLDIYAYIDKRADEIKDVNGTPVYTLEMFLKKEQKKDDFCIIITPKNVFEHSEIANKLGKAGYHNLIFKPKEILNGQENLKLLNINDVFDCLVTSKSIPDKEIEEYHVGSKERNQQLLIKNIDNNYVVFWLPVEFLYSNISQKSIWSNINMCSHFPLIDLYKLFLGITQCAEDAIDNYIDYSSYGANLIQMKITESWRKNAIDTRLKIFYEMQNMIACYPEFFIKNCPEVEYVNDRHFNIISSGKNRMGFLIAKKYRFVPVKIKKESYEHWADNIHLRPVLSYLENNQIQKIDFEIAHPALMNYKSKFPNYVQLWCTEVANRLVKILYKYKKDFVYYDWRIFDYSKDNGTIRRLLDEIGFHMFYKRNDNDIENLLDKAFPSNCSPILEMEEVYDAVIIDTRNNNWKFVALRSKMVFILSWDKSATEEVMKDINYKTQEEIFTSYNEIGVVSGYLYMR